MKAIPYLLAISLAANLVLGWMLWQQRPAPVVEPAVAQSESPEHYEVEALPLPSTPEPLMASPLLPPLESGAFGADRNAPLRMRANFEPTAEDKPYAPPPPPNPHAFPPWQERVPYRESQLDRGLYPTPLRLDK
jgi:hypothetical protein